MRRTDLILKLCACTATVLAIMLVMGIWHLGDNSMIACGFAGAFFIHVGTRPTHRSVLAAVAAAVGLGLCYVACGAHFGGNGVKAFTGTAAFLGCGSLAVMSCEYIWSRCEALIVPLRDALAIPAFSLVAGIAINFVTQPSQATYDIYLYAFDASLGIIPGRIVAGVFKAVPFVGTAAAVIYALLLMFPTLYYAWGLRRGIKTRVNLLHAFIIGGVCGATVYQICPAMGPVYWLKTRFPDHVPALSQIRLDYYVGVDPRNAMPSMHMTWALLVWWAAWELTPIARVLATGFVALTALSTLGYGEHYLIDLVVAVPFALAIEGLTAIRSGPRARFAAGVGFAITAAWVVYLRTSLVIAPPYVGWAAILATIAISTAVQVRFRANLARAVVFRGLRSSAVAVSGDTADSPGVR